MLIFRLGLCTLLILRHTAGHGGGYGASNCNRDTQLEGDRCKRGSAEIDVEINMHKISGRIISRTAFGDDFVKGDKIFKL